MLGGLAIFLRNELLPERRQDYLVWNKKNLLSDENTFDKQEVEGEKIFYGYSGYLFALTVAGALFTYLKNTGKATKKATQSRYSIPLMWV